MYYCNIEKQSMCCQSLIGFFLVKYIIGTPIIFIPTHDLPHLLSYPPPSFPEP
ncbi:hypothetical protein Hanom_Chr01g00019321 [Helianthus anomalus]